MKKLVIATLMMCVTAMSAKAQVLTSETVNNVYETVIHQTNGKYLFNAEWTGKDLTTMYVYKNVDNRKGMTTLKPHMKYEYAYAADGKLTSRTTFRWNDSLDRWTCASRHDYALVGTKYNAEYSRYNIATDSFDLPVEKMVYSLIPDVDVNYVCCYQLDQKSSDYQLVSETYVTTPSTLIAAK